MVHARVNCGRVLQPAIIDDFLPNWSVIQQIQDIRQQMASREAYSEDAAEEFQDVDETVNSDCQHHMKIHQPAEAAAPPTPPPDPHHDTLDRLESLTVTEEYGHVHTTERGGLQQPALLATVPSTSALIAEEEDEQELWQVR